MKTVSDLLGRKGTEVWSVSPEDTVYDALRVMSAKNVGAVLVLEDGDLVGIFSERDYARSVVLAGKASRGTSVGEVMHRDVLYIRPDHTVEDCMVLMTEKHLRHLPVFDDGRLAGLISIGDVVNSIISKQDFKIKQLENWITAQDEKFRY